MAYTPNTLAQRSMGMIEGAFNVWEYTSTDPMSSILTTGYFTDGSSKGMRVGDIVWVVNQSTPTTVQCQVSAATVTTTGGLTQFVGSATVIQISWNLYDNPRNVLDGGDATINPWQRGTSFTGSSATATQYTADRWFTFQSVSATSATVTKSANTTNPGFTQAFQFGRAQSSGSVSTLYFGQVLESNDSYRLQGQTVSFSFFAAANTGFAAGVSGSVVSVNVIQGFGTDQSSTSGVTGVTTSISAWTTQSNVVSGTIGLSTTLTGPSATMTRYSFSGLVSATATQVGVIVSYTPTTTTAVTAENVIMNGFQLETGGVTPFEHREIEQELAFCQRYYFQANETGTSGAVVSTGGMQPIAGSAIFTLALPVQMRAAPTVTVTLGSFGAQVLNAYTAMSTLVAGSTHTVNYISLTGSITGNAGASGYATFLISSSGSAGKIQVTADL